MNPELSEHERVLGEILKRKKSGNVRIDKNDRQTCDDYEHEG
jgi:hypothetical protein